MTIGSQLAKHIRDVHFGGNWTSVSLLETLSGLEYDKAMYKLHGCNSIAALAYHINYYICAVTRVLQGNPLDSKDALSFAHPEWQSEEAWQQFLIKMWEDARLLASLIEACPDEKLTEPFVDEKYGSYYRNLQGIIEHTHYHLGQMVLIKKWLASSGKASQD